MRSTGSRSWLPTVPGRGFRRCAGWMYGQRVGALPQAHQRGAGRQYPVRIPSQPGWEARRTRPRRARRAHRNPSPAPDRPHVARDCGCPEPPIAADASWLGLAAGARSANHQAGNRPSLTPKSLRLGPALARKSTQLHSRLAYSWAPTMCRSAGTRRIDPTPAPRGLRHLLRFAVASSAIHWHLLKFVTV